MKSPLLLLACCLSLAIVSRADVSVPPNVLDPPNAPEAWNVIRLATANVERLLKEDRISEIQVRFPCAAPHCAGSRWKAIHPSAGPS